MPSPRRLTPLATLAAVAVLGGCGSGSSTVSADTYMRSLCSAVRTFEVSLVTRSNHLGTTPIKTPTQRKQALQSFLTGVSGDTDHTLSKLHAAGTPNVKDGKTISGAIVGAFAQLQTAMHSAVSQASQLPTSNQGFQAGAQALSTDLRTAVTSLGQTLQSRTTQSPELQKAAAGQSACKTVTGS